MKKRKLIYFASDEIVEKVNTAELKDFFEDSIEIESYSLTDNIEEKSIDGDLILTLTSVDIPKIQKCLKEEIDIIQGTRTILNKSYRRLKNLPAGIKAMIYNINKKAAFDLTLFLLEMNISHIEYFPVYKGMSTLPDVDVIIIPIKNVVPEFDLNNKEIINLDARRITIETFKAIMLTFNMSTLKLEEKLDKLSLILASVELKKVPVTKISRFEKILNTTINEIDYGIIIINNSNKIIYINNALIEMICIKKEDINLTYLDESILPPKIYSELVNAQNVEYKMLNIKEIGKSFLITKKNIELDHQNLGSIIIFKDTTRIENLEMRLREMIANKGYIAKYTFDDIIGISDATTLCIQRAKKMSLTDKAILVVGESGTGKEMFVQAIHNYSNRKDNPFVAVNCASLSNELLESELFGYEDGAFTGAKKGGKKGLFEMAHKGTIFLDEIGDVSLDVQVKLLRVLQEKEVRKISGDTIIPVDVRVIAATNRDLEQLIDDGKFRMDLYYRLGAFTLFIPPLRERKEDIKLIMTNIFEEIGCTHKLIDNNLMQILYNYKWRGNIRELKNCIEYMSYMGDDILVIEDLPPNFKNNNFEKCQNINGFSISDTELIKFILKSIDEKSSGRRMIYQSCIENGFEITEYKLRSILSYLHKNSYIEYGLGRKGSSLTQEGKLLIE